LKDTILIVGHQHDRHIEAVAAMLIKDKERVRVLTLNNICTTGMNIKIDNDKFNTCLRMGPNKDVVDLSDVKSLWLRRTRMPSAVCTKIKDIASRKFSINDYEYVLRGLYMSTDAFVVSDYYAMRKADNFIYQYAVAREIGLEVPATIITNNPDEALKFAENFGRVCCKPMTDIISLKGGNYFGYTKVIPKDAIRRYYKSIELAPTLIQEYIPKRFDLRINVVGKDVFACAIHSQENVETSEDWRQYYKKASHTIFNLPDYVSEKLISLTQRLGLVFGAIDMILTPDGKFVFIEDNPNGQWYWIQEMTGLNISESIARMLKRASV